MELTFDTQTIISALIEIAQTAWSWVVFLFWSGGWVIILIVIARWLVLKLWKKYLDEIRGNYMAGIDYTTLLIRVPKITEQTPKAVENIFSHLTGLYSGTGNFVDQYITGKVQEGFSCEIISKDGVIQFLIHTPVKFRDVIEAAIFAQYTDVDIVQVPDYVDSVPSSYPSDTHDLWGTELTLIKPFPYPIKTYPAFEHALPGSFKDPIASLLEFMGSLRPGEQVWIQIPLLPISDDWQKDSDMAAKKIMGVKPPAPKPGFLVKSVMWFVGVIESLIGHVWPGLIPPPAKSADAGVPNLLQYLSPGERNVLEQVQMKASKPGFLAKIRIIYVAPKEVFSKGKIVSGVIGAFKQYGASHLNGFKPESSAKVSAGYFNVAKTIAEKQNGIISAYRKRTTGKGGKPFVLNVEELATLWHFPTVETKAPLIRKAEFKRAEPPSELPMREERAVPVKKITPDIEEDDSMPSNLPFA